MKIKQLFACQWKSKNCKSSSFYPEAQFSKKNSTQFRSRSKIRTLYWDWRVARSGDDWIITITPGGAECTYLWPASLPPPDLANLSNDHRRSSVLGEAWSMKLPSGQHTDSFPTQPSTVPWAYCSGCTTSSCFTAAYKQPTLLAIYRFTIAETRWISKFFQFTPLLGRFVLQSGLVWKRLCDSPSLRGAELEKKRFKIALRIFR